MKEKLNLFKKKPKLIKLLEINKEKITTIKQVKEKNKKELKIITYITILAIIIILFLTGYSIGKTISETYIQTNTEIAKPILNLITTEEIKITAENNIGEYPFKILNYKENQISEVPINYTIEIIANTDESINYELYKDGEKILLNNKKTEQIEINANEKEEHNYILKIKYDKTKTDTIYDIIEKIQIKVHSEQKEI